MKKIAIGVDDFKEIRENNYYLVDKSLLIKEAVEEGAKVTLLPRPRRWGKSLNMSMLRYFFEKGNHRHLFQGLAIEKYPKIMAEQGIYQVIYITLKAAKKNSWEGCYTYLQFIMSKIYKEYQYLLESSRLIEQEKIDFRSVCRKFKAYSQSRFILQISRF